MYTCVSETLEKEVLMTYKNNLLAVSCIKKIMM
jgi:hypothetical protein